MTGVFIVPTGIGCEVGGHAGDATPAARLIAGCCDTLLVHPNVVNASDINEMTDNMWYVEGSMLDRYLEGRIGLRRHLSNKILVAVNGPVLPETINAVSAARATLGIDAEMVELKTPLRMRAIISQYGAGGVVLGMRELIEQVCEHDFDALAIASVIDVDKEIAQTYLKQGGINPWGGVEAICSRYISEVLNEPVAHAPVESGTLTDEEWKFESDPRMAAEMISKCYLMSVLKGLHKAPRWVRLDKPGHIDVDFMISPDRCWGPPHEACQKAGIPIIFVHENMPVVTKRMLGEGIRVKNYLEAAGVIMAMRQGISRGAVTRPLERTKVWR